jgi:hypothetical protein
MPAHPRVTASPFDTCRRHKRAFRPPRYRRSTATPCAWSRPSSWSPATSSTWPTATISASPSGWCAPGWTGCVSAHLAAVSCVRRRPRWRPPTSTASPRHGSGDHRHQAARTALIAIDRRSRAAIALAAYPSTPERCRSFACGAHSWLVWVPGVRILGQTAHYSQAIAHFVDRRSRTCTPTTTPMRWRRWVRWWRGR